MARCSSLAMLWNFALVFVIRLLFMLAKIVPSKSKNETKILELSSQNQRKFCFTVTHTFL